MFQFSISVFAKKISSLVLYEKWISIMVIILVFRFTHFIPQSAIWIPFRIPIPPISHLDLFGVIQKKWEKRSVMKLWELSLVQGSYIFEVSQYPGIEYLCWCIRWIFVKSCFIVYFDP